MDIKNISLSEFCQFLVQLKDRNEVLYYFGIINLVVAFGLLVLTFFVDTQFMGTHAFYKPMKFAIATWIYSWTMAWLCFYLGSEFHIKAFSWGIVILLGFEVAYIAIQAWRGQASHYNLTSPFYGLMYTLMALAATFVTIWTAYVGILFFTQKFPDLPTPYLWGIRFGIIMFVIFSFQGFVMGARLSHTVGGLDGSEGYFFLNWSKKLGDLRISHFLGMHALQVIPISAYYILKSDLSVIVFSLVYFLMTTFVLVITLMGKAVL